MAKMRKAVVTPEGGDPVEVRVPEKHPDPKAVAVIAYRKQADAWTDDRKVTVTFPDESPQER